MAFKIYFACTLPGEPGCGCPDGDFLGEHEFVGTLEEAEAEAERISWEVYDGDFRWWIADNTGAIVSPVTPTARAGR